LRYGHHGRQPSSSFYELARKSQDFVEMVDQVGVATSADKNIETLEHFTCVSSSGRHCEGAESKYVN